MEGSGSGMGGSGYGMGGSGYGMGGSGYGMGGSGYGGYGGGECCPTKKIWGSMNPEKDGFYDLVMDRDMMENGLNGCQRVVMVEENAAQQRRSGEA